jgi:hypothetical protein
MDDHEVQMESDTTPGEVSESSERYELILKGEGVTVERNIDQETAFAILAALMGGSPAAAGPAAAQSGPGLGPQRAAESPVAHSGPRASQSLREFLNEAEPKRNPDKIVAIADYLQRVRGMQSVTRDDIKRGFREASEPVPGNYGRDFRWAVSTGWIAADHEERDQYYVTDSGRKVVDAKFPDEAKKTTGVSRTTRRRRSAKKQSGGDDE